MPSIIRERLGSVASAWILYIIRAYLIWICVLDCRQDKAEFNRSLYLYQVTGDHKRLPMTYVCCVDLTSKTTHKIDHFRSGTGKYSIRFYKEYVIMVIITYHAVYRCNNTRSWKPSGTLV